MPKPITFPKTGETWANAETGVFIAMYYRDGVVRYEVRVPALTPNGWQHFAYAATLANARSLGKTAVETVMRPRIESDHDASLREADHRTANAARALVAGIPSRYLLDREVADLADAAQHDAKTTAQALNLAERAVDLAVSKELRESAGTYEREAASAPQCLRVDPPHFVHMRAVTDECRDEQPCEDVENCRTCGRPATVVDGQAEHLDPPPHVNDLHAADLPSAPAPQLQPPVLPALDAAHFGDDYLLPVCGISNGQTITVTFNVEHVTCPVCLSWLARNPDAPQRFAESDAPANDPPAGGGKSGHTAREVDRAISAGLAVTAVDPKTLPAPAAPADLNDDPAWQQYIAALPVPSTDEYAAVLGEFGDPYAEQINDCREAFRTAARSIWRGRAQGTLTGESYRRNRLAMKVARECIATYRGLTQAWARRTAEQYTTA